jgi:hypothetical protein
MLAADSVWKKYLQINYPQVHLITVGFEERIHPNYLFRLDMPADLDAFLLTSLPCSGYWHPEPVPGLQVAEFLTRFYMGHGSDSIQTSFNSLLKDVKVIHEEILKGTEHGLIVDHMIRRENASGFSTYWASFKIRWNVYAPYFSFMPFGELISEGNNLVQAMDFYFSESIENLSLFVELDVLHKTQRIKEIINEIGKYV